MLECVLKLGRQEKKGALVQLKIKFQNEFYFEEETLLVKQLFITYSTNSLDPFSILLKGLFLIHQ